MEAYSKDGSINRSYLSQMAGSLRHMSEFLLEGGAFEDEKQRFKETVLDPLRELAKPEASDGGTTVPAEQIYDLLNKARWAPTDKEVGMYLATQCRSHTTNLFYDLQRYRLWNQRQRAVTISEGSILTPFDRDESRFKSPAWSSFGFASDSVDLDSHPASGTQPTVASTA
jgi:hypothetical protein